MKEFHWAWGLKQSSFYDIYCEFQPKLLLLTNTYHRHSRWSCAMFQQKSWGYLSTLWKIWWKLNEFELISRKVIRTEPVEGVEPDRKYEGHDDNLLDLDIIHIWPFLPGARGVRKKSRTLHLYRQSDILLFPCSQKIKLAISQKPEKIGIYWNICVYSLNVWILNSMKEVKVLKMFVVLTCLRKAETVF